ncbi:MAG: S9 family peptidase [Cyclobacteriaceae bacterium]|nr:S9 family peptidase [Cyclobacteriaceae bacterium]
MNIFQRLSLVLALLLLSYQHSLSGDKPALQYMDIFELQYATNPQISPDGRSIVYIRNHFDLMTDRRITNLWMIDYDGQNHYALTSGKKSHGSASWSPDGKRLAYVSSEDGSAQIFIQWFSTGKSASISNLKNSPYNLAWSPDGKYLAFNMRLEAKPMSLGDMPPAPRGSEWAPPAKVIDRRQYKSDGNFSFVEPGYVHIFLISAEGGGVRQLTSGDYDHGAPNWSSDGSFLIFSANREENADNEPFNTHIYRLDLSSDSIAKITNGQGPHSQPKISPDGKWITFSHYEDRKVGYQLNRQYIMQTDGSGRREISHSLDRDLRQIHWMPDSKGFYAYIEENGDGQLVSVDLQGRVKRLVKGIGGESFGRPYSGGSYSIAQNGRLVYTQSNTASPAELAVGEVKNREIRKITRLNDAFLASRTLGKVEEIWYESSFDKRKIQGWVIYPPGYDPANKYPLILEIHGGPYLSYGPHFTPELQLMAAKGYVVLYINPRGSTSYGEEFASWINHNYPSEDYDDLMSGVDAMIAKGYIDENKLFIVGGSGGGVLTAWSIGKTNRFAAAVVSKPVINWYSFSLTADGYTYYSRNWFKSKPWEDPQEYLNRSPISLIGNVTTPAMLLTGELDYRTPMSETEQYYGALQLQGVPSAMVRIQGAGHGLTERPSNLIRVVSYITGWFEKYMETE